MIQLAPHVAHGRKTLQMCGSKIIPAFDLKGFMVYVIVIPCPRGLYGIYCLSPRAKAINPMRPEGAWYNYFKAYYGNASALL